MLRIVDSNDKLKAVVNNITKLEIEQKLNESYTLNAEFIHQYVDDLINNTNVLKCEGQTFRVFEIEKMHKDTLTISLTAEHISYKLGDDSNKFETFAQSGTVDAILKAILNNTEFEGISNIEGEYTLTGKNITRRALILQLASLANSDVEFDNYNVLINSSIKKNVVYAEFGVNISQLSAKINPLTNTTTYDVAFADIDDAYINEYRKLCVGDTVKIRDNDLNVNVSLKVVGTTRDIINNVNTSITLGDKEESLLINNSTSSSSQPEVAGDEIESIATSTEVSHINNCWTRNLNVEYIETNFSALDVRQPYTQYRNYIRIYDNVIEFHVSEMSQNETEYLKTVDNQDVYWTAINDHEQAYKFFTLTSPLERYQDLTESEVNAFRVQVRKTIKDDIKKKEVITAVDDNYAPIEVLGIGNGTQANQEYQFLEGINLMQNQAVVLKDARGYLIEYYKSNGGKAWLRIGDNGIEMSHSALKSIDFYTDGFKVNGNCKFKWVPNGLLKDDGELIRITELNQNINMEDED